MGLGNHPVSVYVLTNRWTVIFHPEEKEMDEMKLMIGSEGEFADTNEDTTQMFVMNNYMGFGIDAELALDFHTARQKNPDKFNSRLVTVIICQVKFDSTITFIC